ncbi:hypothetical protein CLF_110679, partial [Clonorchis sinensis]
MLLDPYNCIVRVCFAPCFFICGDQPRGSDLESILAPRVFWKRKAVSICVVFYFLFIHTYAK